MAVYTTLSDSQVNKLLGLYGLPPLLTLQGAKDGIENTTYFLALQDGQSFVLTVFEQTSARALLPYAKLTAYLKQQDLPVPAALADLSQCVVQTLNDKPAWLVPKISGSHCLQPAASQCTQVGKVLARFHLATAKYSRQIENPCGFLWLEQSYLLLKSSLPREDQQLLTQQIELAKKLQSISLPRGIIHGDLFRDNVLFANDQLSALIDFSNAGDDFYLLDLAIVVNDWCYSEDGSFIQVNLEALMGAYQLHRPLTAAENTHWHSILQLAATRFWVSRLLAAKKAQTLSRTAPKNPDFYRNLLLKHLKSAFKR